MPKHVVHAGGLAGTPASVVCDVYDAESPGAVLATIPNSDIDQVGSSDIFACNLKLISVDIGLPEDGELVERLYILVFRDDVPIKVSQLYSATGLGTGEAGAAGTRETPIYPSTTVFSRGITQNVIDAGKPSYIKVEIAPDGNFAAPARTFYWVFAYDEQGRVASKTYSDIPPSP